MELKFEKLADIIEEYSVGCYQTPIHLIADLKKLSRKNGWQTINSSLMI